VALTTFISSETTAAAWLNVMEHLLTCEGGKDFNVIAAIQKPCVEIAEATRVLDTLARDLGLKSSMENANSIWPSFFARPGRDANAVFGDIERFVVTALKKACKNRHDSYVERLVAWRSFDQSKTVPQLQNVLTRLKNEVNNRAPKSSSYEISVFSPGLDAGYMSFPCLSHLSVKYDHRRTLLHLTAVYRNHTFLSHAYGNYLGLGRLLAFICAETKIRPGELVSVSTHADAEIAHNRNRTVAAVEELRSVLKASVLSDGTH
jgi:thymidylate synthase